MQTVVKPWQSTRGMQPVRPPLLMCGQLASQSQAHVASGDHAQQSVQPQSRTPPCWPSRRPAKGQGQSGHCCQATTGAGSGTGATAAACRTLQQTDPGSMQTDCRLQSARGGSKPGRINRRQARHAHCCTGLCLRLTRAGPAQKG